MMKEPLEMALKNGLDFLSVNRIPGTGDSMCRSLEGEIVNFKGMRRCLTRGSVKGIFGGKSELLTFSQE